MRRLPFELTVLLPLLALGACRDAGGPGGPLERDEALALLAAVAATTEAASASGAAAGGGALAGSFSIPMAETVPCSPRGEVELQLVLTGSWDEPTKTATLEFDGAETHHGCAQRLDNGGVITLTGDPRLDFTGTGAIVDGHPRPFHFTLAGAFEWRRDGEGSGRCSVNLETVTDLERGTRTFKGTWCGFAIDGTSDD